MRPDAHGFLRGGGCGCRAGPLLGQARYAQLGDTNSQCRILQKTSAIINRILGAGRIGYLRCIHSWIPFRSIIRSSRLS